MRYDYNQMIQAGMFSQKPLSFDGITQLIEKLQEKINRNLVIDVKNKIETVYF